MASTDWWNNPDFKPSVSDVELSEVIDKDIAAIRDFAVGGVKGVSTQVLGMAGDIGELRNAALTAVTGMQWGSEKDRGFPTTREIEQSIGAHNPNPSGAEQAGSVMAGLLDPGVLAAKLGTGALKAIALGRKIPVTDAASSARNLELLLADPKSWVGSEGKLRTELSDKDMKVQVDDISRYLLDVGLKEGGKSGWEGTPIEDLISHPELFDRYPELKDVMVEPFYPMNKTTYGDYNADTKTLRVNPGSNILSNWNNSLDDSIENFKGLVVHELQHGIQSIEDFNKGGNPAQFNPVSPSTWKKTGEDVKKNYTDAVDAIASKLDIDKSAVTPKLVESIAKEHPELHTKYNTALHMARQIDTVNAVNHAKYEAIAGEVEARVTEQRLGMTEAEAEAKPFEEHYTEELERSLNKLESATKGLNK